MGQVMLRGMYYSYLRLKRLAERDFDFEVYFRLRVVELFFLPGCSYG